MPLGRSIPPRRGYVPSVTAGSPVPYEGPLRLDYLYMVDADPRVTALRQNPHTITYVDGRETHEYTPAYIVTRGARKYLVDCVPARRKDSKAMQRRFAAAHEWCETHGYEFEVVTEADIPSGFHMANIRHIHRYIRHQVGIDFEARVYALLAGAAEGLTIAEVIERLAPSHTDAKGVVDGICAMACRKALMMDIERAPLGLDTRVFLTRRGH